MPNVQAGTAKKMASPKRKRDSECENGLNGFHDKDLYDSYGHLRGVNILREPHINKVGKTFL